MAQTKCFGSTNKNIPRYSGDIFYFSAIIFWTFGSGFGEVLGSSLKGRLSPYSSSKTLIQPAIGMATMAPTRPNM